MNGRRLGVLISGRGSNLQAIIDAIADGRLRAEIAVVISNISNAAGLDEGAAPLDIPTARHAASGLRHREPPTIARWPRRCARDDVDLVCLAGFMRLLGTAFIDAFPNRILNIHPSLLPAFPGLDAQRQALQHGVKVTGATVHFVDAALDAGPIVVQAAVPVRADDTVASLAARILVEEHRLYPEAIDRVLERRLAHRRARGWSTRQPSRRNPREGLACARECVRRVAAIVAFVLALPLASAAQAPPRALSDAMRAIFGLRDYTAFDWISGRYLKGTLTLQGWVRVEQLKREAERVARGDRRRRRGRQRDRRVAGAQQRR